MNDKTKQFDKADAAIARAVAAFMNGIEAMFGKWEPVYSTYIVERMLLILCYRSCPMRWPTTGIPDVWIVAERDHCDPALICRYGGGVIR
jgi:hypothetical protein